MVSSLQFLWRYSPTRLVKFDDILSNVIQFGDYLPWDWRAVSKNSCEKAAKTRSHSIITVIQMKIKLIAKMIRQRILKLIWFFLDFSFEWFMNYLRQLYIYFGITPMTNFLIFSILFRLIFWFVLLPILVKSLRQNIIKRHIAFLSNSQPFITVLI